MGLSLSQPPTPGHRDDPPRICKAILQNKVLTTFDNKAFCAA